MPNVVTIDDWPEVQPLSSERLELEPLRPEHADEMAPLLDDVQLHTFIGGQPATSDELRDRYTRQVVGRSPDGLRHWLNWVMRRRDNGRAVGTTQATVSEQPSCSSTGRWTAPSRSSSTGPPCTSAVADTNAPTEPPPSSQPVSPRLRHLRLIADLAVLGG